MTNQASRVSRGLVSIGANIVNMAKESKQLSIEVGKTTENINLFDSATGELKNTYQVLSEVSSYWNQMSKEQQANLSLAMAGKTQMSVFSSILTNFTGAQKAYTTALESQGSAYKENEKYMDSMSAKINLLKSTMQEIVLGEGGLDSFAKGLLDVANNIANFLKDTKALQVGLTVLSAIVGVKLLASFIQLRTTLILNIGLFREAMASGIGLSGALKTVGVSANMANVALGAIGIAITVVAMAWNKYKSAQEEAIRIEEEATQKRIDSIATLSQEMTTLDKAKQSLSNEKITRTELNTIVNSNISAYSDEISKISSLNEARQFAIDKIDEETQKRADRLVKSGQSEYLKALEKEKELMGTETTSGSIAQAEDNLKYLNEWLSANSKLTESYSEMQKNLERTETFLASLYEEQTANNEIIAEFEDAMYVAGKTVDETTGRVRDMTEAEKEAYQTQQELAEATGVSYKNYDELASSVGMTRDELESLADVLGMTVTDTVNLMTSQEDLAKQMEDVNSAMSESLDNLNNIETATTTLANAVYEYNNAGSLSMDTLTNLLALDSEYLALLENENGQYSINQVGLENIANAKIDEAEATAVQKAMTELLEIANDNVAESIDGASTALNNSVTANNNASDGIGTAITACQNGTKAWNEYWSAVSQSVVGTETAETKAVGDGLNNTLNTLEDLRDKIGTYTKTVQDNAVASKKASEASKGSAKSTKKVKTETDKATEAIEKQNKAVKAQIDVLKKQQSAIKDSISDYEDVISYIVDVTEKKIDKLESTKDKALNKLLVQAEKIAGTYEKERNSIEEVMDSLTERYEEERKQIADTRQETIEAYYEEYGEIYDKIEALKAEQAQKEKMAEFEARRKSITEYYDSQISAIESQAKKEEEVNTELERQITLQEKLEALAKAKSSKVKVFKDGKFVYQSNENSIASASKDLADTKTQQQAERNAEAREKLINELRNQQTLALEALEKEQAEYEASLEESYESQLAKLEEQLVRKQEYYSKELNDLDAQTAGLKLIYDDQMKKLKEVNKSYEETEKKYDDQIKAMKKYISSFKKMTEEYEENQIKLLTKQLTGINTEKSNWETRLTNLTNFVNSYNKKLAQLGSIDESISKAEAKQDSLENKKDSITKKTGTGVRTLAPLNAKNKATGDASLSEDGIYRVGEDPNAEIVVGSKLNGSLVSLSRGAGVVNSKSTSKLAGFLSNLGEKLPSGLNQSASVNNSSSSASFTFGDIILPNVEKPMDFVKELGDIFKRYGTQMIGERT